MNSLGFYGGFEHLFKSLGLDLNHHYVQCFHDLMDLTFVSFAGGVVNICERMNFER